MRCGIDVRVPPSYCQGVNFSELIRTDSRKAADVLAVVFGGTWHTWPEETSGVPGLCLAAQYGESADGYTVLTGLLTFGEAITADHLRKISVAKLENPVNLSKDLAHRKIRQEAKKLPPLRREPDMEPEKFSKLVAQHYQLWAKYVPHPAAALAAEWDVKAPTMAGWIREARLRGFLPAAKRKKAADVVRTARGVPMMSEEGQAMLLEALSRPVGGGSAEALEALMRPRFGDEVMRTREILRAFGDGDDE